MSNFNPQVKSTGKRLSQYSLAIILAGGLTLAQTTWALADTAEIVKNWFSDIKKAGAQTAKYDNVVIDGDITKVINPNMAGDFSFEFEGSKITIDYSYTGSEIGMEGLEKRDGGHFTSRMTYSDDTVVSVTASMTENGQPEQVYSVSYAMQGSEVINQFYPDYPSITLSEIESVADFLVLFDWWEAYAAEKVSITKVTATTKDPQQKQVQEFLNFTADGIVNGEMAKSLTEKVIIDTSFKGEFNPLPFDSYSGSYENYVAEGIDIKPIRNLLAGGGNRDVIENMADLYRIGKIELSAVKDDEELFSVSIEKSLLENIGLVGGRPSMIGLIDKGLAGDEPSEEEAAQLAFDILSSFSIEKLGFEGLSIKSLTPEFRDLEIESFYVENLGNGYLGSFNFSGINFSNDIGMQASLDKYEIGEVTFPAVADLMAFTKIVGEPSPQQIMNTMPKVGVNLIEGLNSSFVGINTTIDKMAIIQKDFIGAIPTQINIDLENLNVPVQILPPEMQLLLSGMGKNDATFNGDISLNWNEESQNLTMEPSSVSMEDGGIIEMEMELGGVQKLVFENPDLAQQTLATLTFNGFRAAVKDAPLVTAMLEFFANAQGDTADVLRETILTELKNNAGPFASNKVFQDATVAVKSFLENPDRLEVSMEPQNPVPAFQLLGAFTTNPDQIPEILGASVSAN